MMIFRNRRGKIQKTFIKINKTNTNHQGLLGTNKITITKNHHIYICRTVDLEIIENTMANINRDDIPDFGLDTFTVDAVKRIILYIIMLDKIKEKSGHKSEIIVISLVDHAAKLKITHVANSVFTRKKGDIIIGESMFIKPSKERISP